MGKEKILIFDVCEGNIAILDGILAKFDFQVSRANDKSYFYELLKENKFDLIFCNIQNSANEIKTLKRAIASGVNADSLFVLMPEDNLGDINLKVLDRNVISVLEKPFNIEIIKTVIKTFVRLNEMKEISIKEFYDSLACFVHDLKTPLVARDYASKMLLDDTSSLTESQKEILQELHLSTKYLLALTNNFLAKYKYENSKIVLSKSLRDIVLDLREVIFEIKYYAKSRACEMVLKAPDECFLQYDEIGIKRIFYNLLINAIKYSPRNSEIKIVLVESAKKLVLTVENDTEKIEKSKFRNIFKKFVSCKKSGTEGGCGIGLAIAKKIAKMHKGDLTAKIEKANKENELHKIIFELTLPTQKHAIKC